jgi:hypothetical protein
MPRLARVAPIGIPQHIIQRGNNRHIYLSLAATTEDRLSCYRSLFETQIESQLIEQFTGKRVTARKAGRPKIR